MVNERPSKPQIPIRPSQSSGQIQDGPECRLIEKTVGEVNGRKRKCRFSLKGLKLALDPAVCPTPSVAYTFVFCYR